MNPSRRRGTLYGRMCRVLADEGVPTGPAAPSVVTEADLDGVPDAGRRYLDFMGVVGGPRHSSFRVRFDGRFRLRDRWMPAVAWQYDTAPQISRVYVMRLRIGGIVPMIGVDRYVGGRGEMRGRLLGVVPVVHGEGEEFDLGELATWLNDAVLLAPSFLLTSSVSWDEVDDESFDLRVADAGKTVTARVFLDERGAPRDFSTTDRWADLPSGLTRAEWTTPVDGWTLVDGRPWPTTARATWHFPEGPLTYVEGRFAPDSIAYDVAPHD